METIPTTIPEHEQAQLNAIQKDLQSVHDITITNQTEFERAGQHLIEVTKREKAIKEIRLNLTRPIDEAKKRIMDLFKPAEQFCTHVKSTLNHKMTQYHQEQEAKRKELEAAEEARRQKEAAKLEERADNHEAKGRQEKADALREKAQDLQNTAVTMATSQQPAGVRRVVRWKARVRNWTKIPPHYFLATDAQKNAHESHFNQIATATKGTLEIPGVEFYTEESFTKGR